VDECLQTSISRTPNGEFVAFCTDCLMVSSNSSFLPANTDQLTCKDACKQAGNCFGFEYNHSSHGCLLNFDSTGNINVEQLPKDSMVEVWIYVPSEIAARYSDASEKLSVNNRIRPELFR
jgi:hypothetical protein